MSWSVRSGPDNALDDKTGVADLPLQTLASCLRPRQTIHARTIRGSHSVGALGQYVVGYCT